MPLVECAVHGRQPETFVCQHVAKSLETGDPVGFYWSIEPTNSERPDAWCTRCNELIAANGSEWNAALEESAGITLLCGACYDRAKRLAGF